MGNTRKKVKVIGTEQYINKDGVLEDFQVIKIEERDANFHKLWLGHIIQSIDLIGNQKTKLAFWILDNLNSENQLIMTQRKIAENTGMSTKTVSQTIKALIDSNFLIKINSGAYRVNPDVMFKGGKNQRLNVLLQYQEEQEQERQMRIEDYPEVVPSTKLQTETETQSQEQPKSKPKKKYLYAKYKEEKAKGLRWIIKNLININV